MKYKNVVSKTGFTIANRKVYFTYSNKDKVQNCIRKPNNIMLVILIFFT